MNKLVSVQEIPRTTNEVVGDPISIYRKFVTLQAICQRENGVGLAAVQIGLPDRMFVTKSQDESFRYFLNTQYAPVGDEKFTSCEGCLSLPNRLFLVSRNQTVKVTGMEMLVGEGVTFQDVDFEVSDPLYTAVFQHEIGHCFGELISEIGKEVRIRPA